MNRSIAMVGVGIILAGLALVASPIVLTGAEQFTIMQEIGIFTSPVGLVVVMIGAVQANPQTTTVGGTFGNPEAKIPRPRSSSVPPLTRPSPLFNPLEPADCRYCPGLIPFDLAFCPRCGRPRECRGCGRTLGVAETRTDCPGCHRAEAFCSCPRAARVPGRGPVASPRIRRG